MTEYDRIEELEREAERLRLALRFIAEAERWRGSERPEETLAAIRRIASAALATCE